MNTTKACGGRWGLYAGNPACAAAYYAKWPPDGIPAQSSGRMIWDYVAGALRPAQGTEAQRAETSLGSVHDGPVRVANAPKLTPGGSHG